MKTVYLALLVLCQFSLWNPTQCLPGSPIAPRMATRFGMFPSSNSRATLILRPNLRVLDPRTAMDRMGKTALLETQIGQEIKALLGGESGQEQYYVQKLKDLRDDPNSYLSLSECRNSVHCHQLFTKYLASIMEGKGKHTF